MKHFSLAQLILQWLSLYPNDYGHPDLIQMASAGYVQKRGLDIYYWHKGY